MKTLKMQDETDSIDKTKLAGVIRILILCNPAQIEYLEYLQYPQLS